LAEQGNIAEYEYERLSSPLLDERVGLYGIPEDVHTVSNNASKTEPAKFVFSSKMKEHRFSLLLTSFLRAMYFLHESFLPENNLPYRRHT
jgi:hypothetical protein